MKGSATLKQAENSTAVEQKLREACEERDRTKAPCYETYGKLLPMNHFSDDVFELFVSDVLIGMQGKDKWSWYEDVHRFNGGSDGGRDVMLHKDGVCVGAVQCKKFNSPVTLTMVLQELTKYFLHATFNTTMHPGGSGTFHWYLAASEGVSSKGLEFLLSWGETHLEKYRKELNDAAEAVRNKYNYLKTRSELAKLTGEQLCNLIWQRLINIRLGVMRNIELSKYANDLPEILTTYYHLRPIVTGDFTEILAEMRKMIHIAQPCSAEDDYHAATDIVPVYIPHSLLNGDTVNLTLLSAHKVNALIALEKLLVTQCQMSFTRNPVVIIAGATSFKPLEYTAIWSLLQKTTHPVILVAGCGKVTGEQLKEWRDNENLIIAEDDHALLPKKVYQAGWCWTRLTPESIQCRALIGNVSSDSDCHFGSKQLCLIFKDAHFWPALGHDFFCGWEPARSLLRKLFMFTNEQNKSLRQVVALCADKPSPPAEIDSAIMNCKFLNDRGKLFLVLCHEGSVDYGPSRRSMSGVFPGKNPSSALMPIKDLVPRGVILRSPRTDLALMTLNLLTHEADVGSVELYHLSQNTLVEDEPAFVTELLHILNQNQHIIPTGVMPLAIDTLRRQYLVDKGYSAALLAHHSLEHLKPYHDVDPDCLALSSEKIAILAELSSFLSHDKTLEWQTEVNQAGTLRWGEPHKPIHIVALENMSTGYHTIANQIADWLREPGEHPCLHVLARARGGFSESTINPDDYPRANVAMLATPHEERDAAECMVTRKASIGELNELDSLYLQKAWLLEIHAFLLKIRRMNNG